MWQYFTFCIQFKPFFLYALVDFDICSAHCLLLCHVWNITRHWCAEKEGFHIAVLHTWPFSSDCIHWAYIGSIMVDWKGGFLMYFSSKRGEECINCSFLTHEYPTSTHSGHWLKTVVEGARFCPMWMAAHNCLRASFLGQCKFGSSSTGSGNSTCLTEVPFM